MNENEIIKLTRRRLLSNFINFISMPVILFLPIFVVMKILNIQEFNLHLIGFPALIVILIYLPLIHILYFGLFVKLTDGYTIGGFITGIKIVRLDGKKLDTLNCAKRFLNAWNSGTYYTGYIYTKINSIGQFYYDEKYNTTIVIRGQTIPKTDNIKYYEHNFAKEFIIVFFAVFLGLNILSFILQLVFG